MDENSVSHKIVLSADCLSVRTAMKPNVPLVGAVTVALCAMERYLPHQNGSSISSDGIPQQIP